MPEETKTIETAPEQGDQVNSLVTPAVLDACCGSRMMWFNKADDRALFIDVREGVKDMDFGTPATKGNNPCVIAPDQIADFRSMPFPNDSFMHVVFDPPHVEKKIGNIKSGIIPFKYGVLASSWRDDLRQGFAECFRVLKPNGTLVFKWSEVEIPLKDVLKLTDEVPLYGHRSGKKANTHWVVFLKTQKRIGFYDFADFADLV